MKSYTDIEQSKKLAEILPIESADMIYMPMMDIDSMSNSGFFNIPECYPFNEFKDSDTKPLPCWSLAALMNILDRGALFVTPQGWACQSYINFKAITSDHHSNPIDACYEIILRLHELKML